MTSVQVRAGLVRALELDLVGPAEGLGDLAEILPQTPSRWYLTGFLVPVDAPTTQKADETIHEELDAQGEGGDVDEDSTAEGPSAKKSFYPSSCGLSFLVPKETVQLQVAARWGDYKRIPLKEGDERGQWHRTQCRESLTITVPPDSKKVVREVPNSGGLQVVVTVREVNHSGHEGGLPKGAKSVSVFLVNRRPPSPDISRDESFLFQSRLEVEAAEGFLPRPNPRGLESNDWDERLADLQYRQSIDYAVGHSVSVEAFLDSGQCVKLATRWLPDHQVERVAPAKMSGVLLGMDDLAALPDASAAKAGLQPMVDQYRAWITHQVNQVGNLAARRKEVVGELKTQATRVASRIEAGIALLADPQCLYAFQIANRAMANAARQRMGVMQGKVGEELAAIRPEWRPFQLAFLLMNLKGVADPTHHDRGVVDLLFFPTGGGKTEAYLGLAAFTLVLRRLKNPGIASAGLSVLMRYTLRLLTLDQLGRASTLICALEQERWADPKKLGEWPFEIGLWVGRAATPNHMGEKGDNKPETARQKTIAYLNDDRKASPVPLEDCPWCGTKFNKNSFKLWPNRDNPENLHIHCLNRDCAFSGGKNLPILAVDEPIYKRLPCFLIATVDKFAAMPWTGEVGGFFGRVQRYDATGFYGPCNSGGGKPLPVDRLPPPDLVIQDELHLISGPLGTIVGLYEAALDELSSMEKDGKKIYPKIVASTATVRRAESQIQALFNRRLVDIFPPPGPDRRDSFFAETLPPEKSNARLYLGVPAQGRSAKVVQLRVYLVLLAAAKHFFDLDENLAEHDNPADPYMTLLGYFNSLRELGGTRRLVEDEVLNGLDGYARRKRVGEETNSFGLRTIDYEPVELTSRISTAKVSEYKRQLENRFANPEKGFKDKRSKPGGKKADARTVDVAIATNMISVGLDITRLGLMVVYGQPKTSAEYIQASSRVGRDEKRPGLVVTILNVKKPRDRSHYEQFASYHESFYRSVEATSVTPFSPRALDRGLAGVLVALVRQGHQPMTAAGQASMILTERPNLEWVVKTLAERARECCGLKEQADRDQVADKVKARAFELLDLWSKEAERLRQNGISLQYQMETSGAQFKRLLYEFLHPYLRDLPLGTVEMKFRANRSMRDVEPSVNLFVHRTNGTLVDAED